MNDSLTPMMQQYRELKARDPDALLLFRMGDFYEMFGDDAERAAPLLGLALTSRDKGADAVPMAGFPHPALDTYLAKIVQAGPAGGGLRAGRGPATGQGAGQARRRPGRHARDPDRRRAARPQDGQLPGGGRRGRGQARPGLGRALDRPVLADRACCGPSSIDEIARLNPAEILISELSLDAPWARAAARPVGDGDHGPALVGLPARAGPQDALRAVRDDDAGRVRRRRPRPRGPGRRGPDGLPARDPEDRRSATSPG